VSAAAEGAAPRGAARRRGLGRLLPRSLAGRTALALLLGLVLVQVAGLTIHALDRIDLQRFQQARDVTQRAFAVWRTLLVTPPERRAALLAEYDLPPGLRAAVEDAPDAQPDYPPPPRPLARLFRVEALMSGPPRLRPRELIVSGSHRPGQMLLSARFQDGQWLNLRVQLPPPRPWHSETFLIAFLLMTMAAAALTLWAVRRLTRPVRDLAAAADRLGRDVNACRRRARTRSRPPRAPSTPWPSGSAASSATARRCSPPSATT